MGHTLTDQSFIPVTLTARIKMAPDTYALDVKPIDGGLPSFDFQAGQYAILSAAGEDSRPYSIASMPQSDHLSFHIKDMGRGLSHVLATAEIGLEMSVSFPHGSATYQAGSDRPILAIGGGLGIAPLVPIVKTALIDTPLQKVFIFHGGETAADLYLNDTLAALQNAHDNVTYIGVTEADPLDGFEVGLVGDVALKHINDFSPYDAYITGSPSMVVATAEVLMKKGLKKSHIFTDAPL